MKLTVRLFAMVRDSAGDGTLELELPAEPTIAIVRNALIDRLPERASLAKNLRFAVNAEYANDETVVQASDEVACIPPVSGG